MSYTFIINPRSGPDKKKSFLIELIKNKAGSNAQIKTTSYAGHASILTAEAVKQGSKNIIAVGGDGTLNEVAKELVGKDVNFGLIPMGSGNGFARSLNIPLNIEKALDVINKKHIKKIDVGLVNGTYFFVISGFGFEANVANRFQKSRKRGPLPYFYNGMKGYLNYTYQEFGLFAHNKNTNIKPLTVAVANAPQYGNNAIISPDSDLQDGFLDVCIISKFSFLQGFKAIKDLFNGKIARHKFYSTFKAREITFTSEEDILFHTDGEINKTSGRLEYKTLPKALNVIC